MSDHDELALAIHRNFERHATQLDRVAGALEHWDPDRYQWLEVQLPANGQTSPAPFGQQLNEGRYGLVTVQANIVAVTTLISIDAAGTQVVGATGNPPGGIAWLPQGTRQLYAFTSAVNAAAILARVCLAVLPRPRT